MNFRTILSVCFFLFSFSAFSQLKIYPVTPAQKSAVQKKTSKTISARTQELVPRSLPFWDDFSTTPVYDRSDTIANYPADSLWVFDSDNVSINNGLALFPPSVNVATFDGLDSTYSPYSLQPTLNGVRDVLTSQAIKLAEVVGPERNSVYLSFFYQWSGNGEPPDSRDYLLVEFKNESGDWESVMEIRTTLAARTDAFYDTLVKVDGDRFFHDEFQFRFLNYGRLSGPYDTWNLDYIYLNKNRSASDRYLPDRTIASSLGKLFGDYRAVPYDHFLANTQDIISNPGFDVFNVKNDTSTLSYWTVATFTNYKDSVPTITVDTLGSSIPAETTPIDGESGVIFQRQRKQVIMQNIPDRTLHFDENADSVDISLKVQLFTGDTFNPTNGYADDYDPAIYSPLDFRTNDTLRTNYFLRKYYAYDDGSGEYAVGLTAFGNRAAVAFDMLIQDPDTIVGFDVYFPDYGVVNNLSVDFTLYADDGGMPGVAIVTFPAVNARQNGYNNFQRVELREAFLVEKRFYIGWRAPVGGILRVGLDTNSDSGDKLFVNTKGSWEAVTDIAGSVMIRPLFKKGNLVQVAVEDELPQGTVYPVPNEGEFFIPKGFNVLQVNSVIGQPVSFQTAEQGENQKVLLQDKAPGVYIIRLQKGSRLFSSKILVR